MFENLEVSSGKTRKRLDEISHHFLSDAPAKTRKGRGGPFLPVLVLDQYQLSIVNAINEQLNLKGYRSNIIYIQEICRQLGLSDHQASFTSVSMGNINWDDRTAVYNQFRSMVKQQAESDVYLIPVYGSQYRLLDLIGRVVILSHATLKGISAAYAQIKELSPCALKSINIIMLSDDVQNSLRHYKKLADGVSRFLGRKIVNSGFVIQQNGNLDTIDADLIDIKDLLQR